MLKRIYDVSDEDILAHWPIPEKILNLAIDIRERKALDKEASVEDAVQEKNITYPADPKL